MQTYSLRTPDGLAIARRTYSSELRAGFLIRYANDQRDILWCASFAIAARERARLLARAFYLSQRFNDAPPHVSPIYEVTP